LVSHAAEGSRLRRLVSTHYIRALGLAVVLTSRGQLATFLNRRRGWASNTSG